MGSDADLVSSIEPVTLWVGQVHFPQPLATRSRPGVFAPDPSGGRGWQHATGGTALERARLREQRGAAGANPRPRLGGYNLEPISDFVEEVADPRGDVGEKGLRPDDVGFGTRMRIQATIVNSIVHAAVHAVVHRLRCGVAAIEPRPRLGAPARVRGLSGRLIEAVHRIDGGRDAIGLDQPVWERPLDLPREERVSTFTRELHEN